MNWLAYLRGVFLLFDRNDEIIYRLPAIDQGNLNIAAYLVADAVICIVSLLFWDGCKKASSAVGTDKKFRNEGGHSKYFLFGISVAKLTRSNRLSIHSILSLRVSGWRPMRWAAAAAFWSTMSTR